MKEYLILTYLGNFVNENLLANGIYTTFKPTLHNKDITKDDIKNDFANLEKYFDEDDMEVIINNLEKCELKKYKLEKV